MTLAEVEAWVLAVAGIPASSWRYAWYVRGWDVPGKVRQAKLAGTFEAIVSDREHASPSGFAAGAVEVLARFRAGARS